MFLQTVLLLCLGVFSFHVKYPCFFYPFSPKLPRHNISTGVSFFLCDYVINKLITVTHHNQGQARYTHIEE